MVFVVVVGGNIVTEVLRNTLIYNHVLTFRLLNIFKSSGVLIIDVIKTSILSISASFITYIIYLYTKLQ